MRTIRIVFPFLLSIGGLGGALAQTAADKAAVPPGNSTFVPHDSRLQTPPVAVAEKPAMGGVVLPGQATVAVAQNRPACYAIRSYNFAPGEAASDITRPKSVSTCSAAADTRLKGAAVVVQR